MVTALSLHHSLLLEVSHTFFRNNHNSKDMQIQHVYLVEDSNMNHHLDILRPYQHTHCFHSVLHSLGLEDNLRQRVIEITINLCMLIRDPEGINNSITAISIPVIGCVVLLTADDNVVESTITVNKCMVIFF